MKSPKKNGIGEVVTDYGRRVMRIFKKGLLQRSLFDFYGDIKADTVKVKESSSVPNTPVDGDGGVVYVKSTDGKLYFKSNEVSEVELSSQGTNTTYSVSCVDGDNSDEEKIRLTGSDSSTDDVVLEAGTGLSIARDGDKITFTNTVTDTDTVLTTEQVQDIAGALVATGGTKTGITVTYDDVNNNMDFVVGTDITLTTAAQPNITSLGTLTGLTVSGDPSFTSDSFTITSATDSKPVVSIVSTTTGNKPPSLVFQKTDTGAALDSPGLISFMADDDANNETVYGNIQSQIVSAANNSEAGKLSIEVATSDGSGTGNKNGILFTGSATANDIDVTIGAETTSLTTIAGNLQVNGSDTTISNNLTVTSGTSGDATLIISADTDNNDEADGPRLWFKADGDITEGAIQQNNNTIDIISNVSSGGGIRFLTGTTDNTGTTDPSTGTTERLSISSAGVVSTSGDLTVGGDLTVSGNDIKDSGGNTIISSDGSGDVTFGGTNIFLDGSNANLKFDSGSDIILGNDVNGGDGTSNINYRDSGGTARVMLGPAGSDVVALANRASNGTVQIRANSSTAGSGGEVTVVTVEDDKVTISQNLELSSSLIAPKRKFTITGNTDGTHDGDVVFIGGTTSMTTGAIYHFNSSGNWQAATASDTARSTGLLGVSLGSASDTDGVLLRGMVTLNHDPGGVGDTLYLNSNTSGAGTGGCNSTAPSGNGDIIRIVGYCLDASNGQIWFNPDSTFIEYTT